MNIVIGLDDFKTEHAFFSPPVKNMVIEESNFIKLIYSNSIITLNCIYIQVPLRFLYTERYFNKFKYSFDINDSNNMEVMKKLYSIELDILGKINIKKTQVLHLYDKLSKGVIKMDAEREHKDAPDKYVFLKISGVWETADNYGLTCKFV